MSDSPEPGVDGGNALSQKMLEATIFIIIGLGIRLNGMVAQADLTRSLTVWTKSSISGKCYFLYEHFSFIYIAVIYSCSGSNSLSACIFVILKQ